MMSSFFWTPCISCLARHSLLCPSSGLQLRGLPEDLVAFPHAGRDRPHRGPGPQPAVTWEGPAEDTGGVLWRVGGSTFRTKRLLSIGEEEGGNPRSATSHAARDLGWFCGQRAETGSLKDHFFHLWVITLERGATAHPIHTHTHTQKTNGL